MRELCHRGILNGDLLRTFKRYIGTRIHADLMCAGRHRDDNDSFLPVPIVNRSNIIFVLQLLVCKRRHSRIQVRIPPSGQRNDLKTNVLTEPQLPQLALQQLTIKHSRLIMHTDSRRIPQHRGEKNHDWQRKNHGRTQ